MKALEFALNFTNENLLIKNLDEGGLNNAWCLKKSVEKILFLKKQMDIAR